jgi:hypothetical protein
MNICAIFALRKSERIDGPSFQGGKVRLEPIFLKVYAYAHGHCLNFNLRGERIGRK